MNNWFEVDKEGLAKLLERKGGKQFAVFELIQNAWDENSTRVDIEFHPIENCHQAYLRVEDDNPEGFTNIDHAFTLFAESNKKSDPTKRGRFNLGEKLVLACCVEATISTTKGTIDFYKNDRVYSSKKRESGSVFSCCIKMSRAEIEEISRNIHSLIPPHHIKTYFNGKLLECQKPLVTFEAPLPTEKSDEDGILRRTIRKTIVSIYEVKDGEVASLYELGIPVCELPDDKYHVDIGQKVPLNMDRDNVPPSYLRDIRHHVLNHTYNLLKPDDVTRGWVRDACTDPRCDVDAIKYVMKERFGEKVVAFDPTDLEANKNAVAQGYTVLHGGTLSHGEWSNVKSAGIALPSGRVTPSPKPFSSDGKPLSIMDRSKWDEPMFVVEAFARRMARAVGIPDLVVVVTNDVKWPFAGCYGDGRLTINRGRLGKKFFEDFPDNRAEVVAFLTHEFAHQRVSDHLSSAYYDEICRIAGVILDRSLNDPEYFWID